MKEQINKNDGFDKSFEYFERQEENVEEHWACPADNYEIIRAEECFDCLMDALDFIDENPDDPCLICKMAEKAITWAKSTGNKSKTKQRGSVLKKALSTINGERQDSYGSPEDSFQLIADFWTTYLGVSFKISARQVSEMMMLFKIARMKGQKPHADNYVDAAGYCGIAADMLEDEI